MLGASGSRTAYIFFWKKNTSTILKSKFFQCERFCENDFVCVCGGGGKGGGGGVRNIFMLVLFFKSYPNFGTFLLNKKYYWGTKTPTLSHVPIDYAHVFSGELTIDQQCRIISILNFLILWKFYTINFANIELISMISYIFLYQW